ncbi:MAG: DUF1573 domain-containing protein [Clostridiaceae bacterium]|jgi:hypothetical protein|nr:DUF1573 domain-containing protein [Clostridiaceae bacterium]
MKETTLDSFQFAVSELLVRNKSILDEMSKIQDSNARINRTISKAVTQCGCIKINASKQDYPEDIEYTKIKDYMSSHLEGKLCPNCRDILEKDIGRHLFYLTTICNNLDLNLYDIILKESERLRLFGKFNLR